MAILKAKTTIECATCGCSLKRCKSIKVAATDKDSAIVEGRAAFSQWVDTLKGQNCKVCTSIIASM